MAVRLWGSDCPGPGSHHDGGSVRYASNPLFRIINIEMVTDRQRKLGWCSNVATDVSYSLSVDHASVASRGTFALPLQSQVLCPLKLNFTKKGL
ncbi:hypothetical protein TNCV_1725891 [Trichonephila clavipes]|nr:hypothetical protein TNCV_1725891 [Trichonephila clavipes]